MTAHSLLWRILDAPGHDACRYRRDPIGWITEGASVFAEDGRVHALTYRLRCDHDWNSRSASVEGWIGDAAFALELARNADGGWTVDGQHAPGLAGCLDIDLGFTPATNINAMRRLALAAGERRSLVAVWLDTEDWSVKPLPQSYHRIADDAYDYASPHNDFRARLRVDRFGAVTDYEGIWTSEAVPLSD